MGGELEKSTLHQKTSSKLDGKAGKRNSKSILKAITTDENHSPNKNKLTKTALKTTNNNLSLIHI